jgi:hypothetical protein
MDREDAAFVSQLVREKMELECEIRLTRMELARVNEELARVKAREHGPRRDFHN